MAGARLIFATAFFLASLSTLASAQAGSADTADVRTAATAHRSVRPDQAVFTLQFTADGPTPIQAGQRLAARADTVRRALMALGIARDSIVTGSTWYRWPERIQVLTSQRRIPATPPARGYQIAVDTIPLEPNSWYYRPILDTTYRAREILEVRVDPSRVGPAIDAALALPITDISRIRFSVSDVRQVQLELLREATERVSEQASAIAAASGGRLGRVLYLGTQAPDPYGGRYGFETIDVRGTLEVTSAGTEITAPSVAVSVTVHGRWLLMPR